MTPKISNHHKDVLPPANHSCGENFFGMGIVPKILEILEKMKFCVPTAIQFKAIPLAIEGKDVIGIAQTGTGKTHSFAIPMVQYLACEPGTGLVLAPTRELAIQIDESFQELAHAFEMLTACLIGGAPIGPQVEALRKNPRIVIATPGRLLDHMKQWNIVLDDLKMLVFDEADRMLDMGFAPQIDKLLRFLPKKRQTMLFSATMPKGIMAIAYSVSFRFLLSNTGPKPKTNFSTLIPKDFATIKWPNSCIGDATFQFLSKRRAWQG